MDGTFGAVAWKTMQPRMIFALTFALLAVGCRPEVDRAPRPVRFVQDGAAYEWGLAHGVVGSLALYRVEAGGHSRPYVMMTCRNLAAGGLQIRDATAGGGNLSIMAAGETFSVPPVSDGGPNGPSFYGEGMLPADWFDMLAMSTTVTISYGGKTVDFPAPGTDVVGHYERYCTKLQNKT